MFELAHRNGLGAEFEAASLRAALSSPGRPAGTFLSLNVTPTAFTSDAVQAVLPESLEGMVIEITEGQLIDAENPVYQAITIARARGATVAMDDVGTGYAGLTQLMGVMPEMIKLDRRLVSNCHENLAQAALIEALVGYGERTHTLVCAEGVESREEVAIVRELGVKFCQGYAIGRPASLWQTESALDVAAVAGEAMSTLRKSTNNAGLELVTSDLARASSAADLSRVAEHTASTLGADEAYISILHERDCALEVIAGFGGPGIGVSYPLRDYPATARLLESFGAVQILAGDPAADPAEVRLMRAEGIKALLMVAIEAAKRCVGLLELYRRAERRWDEGEIGAARATSQQIGTVIERLRSLDRLDSRARTPSSSNRLAEMVRRRVGLE